jgi:hypothetical protein
MAISNVAIVNRALQKLGAERIESLTQDHPNARSMNAAFEQVRDAELRRYVWTFAIKRASIAADASDTLWGDWNQYSLPNDFLRLIRDDETGHAPDWRIEGLYIITQDAAPLEIRYVAKITDPNYFDSLFVEALACKLAVETCEEITQSTSKAQRVRGDYDFAIGEAKRISAIEKEAQEFPEDSWLTARY